MPSLSMEEAIAKAKSYAHGEEQINRTPPKPMLIHKSTKGICDSCAKKKHVLTTPPNQPYKICHACIHLLKSVYSDKWGERVVGTVLQAIKSREIKAQVKANKKRMKK